MTKKILLTVFITFCAINIASAKLKIPVCFPCESLETVIQLPDDSKLQEMAGEKVNISYINEEYGILWVSAWNTNGRYVLSDVGNNSYYDIDEEAAKILKEDHDFDIETAENPLSFWKKIGGKLVYLILIGIIAKGALSKDDDDDETVTSH